MEGDFQEQVEETMGESVSPPGTTKGAEELMRDLIDEKRA